MKKNTVLILLLLSISFILCACLPSLPPPSGSDSDQTDNMAAQAEQDLEALMKEPVPFSKSGKGDTIVTDLVTESDYTILRISVYDRGYFSLLVYDSSNLIACSVIKGTPRSGEWTDGYILLDHISTYKLNITTQCEWKVEVVPFTKSDTTSFSGKGYAVTGVFVADTTKWNIKYSGSTNISVQQYSLSGTPTHALLLNEMGNKYDISVLSGIKKGTVCFFVIETSSGEWEISPQ
ncbi:MAG: hypothetical protein LBB49_05020 [Gracilibacteraceae bacterium]|jgi:hypothetical protein|nr:hypothetical protein [Gracilibacteraceae bacterium]